MDLSVSPIPLLPPLLLIQQLTVILSLTVLPRELRTFHPRSSIESSPKLEKLTPLSLTGLLR